MGLRVVRTAPGGPPRPDVDLEGLRSALMDLSVEIHRVAKKIGPNFDRKELAKQFLRMCVVLDEVAIQVGIGEDEDLDV